MTNSTSTSSSLNLGRGPNKGEETNIVECLLYSKHYKTTTFFNLQQNCTAHFTEEKTESSPYQGTATQLHLELQDTPSKSYRDHTHRYTKTWRQSPTKTTTVAQLQLHSGTWKHSDTEKAPISYLSLSLFFFFCLCWLGLPHKIPQTGRLKQ